jgi:hypothetical protein
MTTRKPKVGVQRRPAKQPGESKDQSETNENPTKKGFPDRPMKPKPPTHESEDKDEEEWESVSYKHRLRNTSERNQLERVVPKLDAIMARRIKLNTEKPASWVINKFQKVKEHIKDAATDANINLKTKHVIQQMKCVANEIGNPELFNTKKKECTARKTHSKKHDRPTAPVPPDPVPPEPSNAAFEKTAIDEFDLESDQEPEQKPDVTDLPELDQPEEEPDLINLNDHKEDDITDKTDHCQQEMGTSSSESTDGVGFILQLENTQNSIDDCPSTQFGTRLTQIDAKGKTADKLSAQEKHKLNQKRKEIETLDETTQNVDDQVKTAERLLDKEAQEIAEIQVHAPKTHCPKDSYEECDFEAHAAQAI